MSPDAGTKPPSEEQVINLLQYTSKIHHISVEARIALMQHSVFKVFSRAAQLLGYCYTLTFNKTSHANVW